MRDGASSVAAGTPKNGTKAASLGPKSMSGRLKKPRPRWRMARISGFAPSLAREDLGLAEALAAAPERGVEHRVALLLVDRGATARLEQLQRHRRRRRAPRSAAPATSPGLSLRSAKPTSPSTWIRRFSRSGGAYQSSPRSSRLRPSQPKCSRTSARRRSTGRCGKHSSTLRSATRRRDRGQRVQQAPERAAERRLHLTAASCCSSRSSATQQRASRRSCGRTPSRRPRGCL